MLSLFVLLLARVRSLNCEMLTGIHSLKVHARICACACAYWYTMRPHHDSYSACSQHCQLSACYAVGVAKYRSPAVRHLGCTVRADACKHKHNRKPRSPCPALPDVPRALLSVRPALLRVANVPRALLCLCSWASSGPEHPFRRRNRPRTLRVMARTYCVPARVASAHPTIALDSAAEFTAR